MWERYVHNVKIGNVSLSVSVLSTYAAAFHPRQPHNWSSSIVKSRIFGARAMKKTLHNHLLACTYISYQTLMVKTSLPGLKHQLVQWTSPLQFRLCTRTKGQVSLDRALVKLYFPPPSTSDCLETRMKL